MNKYISPSPSTTRTNRSGNVPEILFDVGVYGSQIDDLGLCHEDGPLNSPQVEKLGIESVYVLIQRVNSKLH